MTIASAPIPMPLTMEEAARRLAVPEACVHEWLTSFRWERRYDGFGHLLLEERDFAFLKLIKSLKDVDRTCESIVRLISDDPAPSEHFEEPLGDLAQFESLKAELLDLHARPVRRPWWKFWA
ncbi:MAG: hypothetical protein JWM80_1156 [Cyanobacteria bacterium RYN_339]|nr:hypothetical protein [Cyanobacteria bacterium RYN_339]